MGFHKLGIPTTWLLVWQFKAWGELHCPNPLRSKVGKITILECGLGVERWV